MAQLPYAVAVNGLTTAGARLVRVTVPSDPDEKEKRISYDEDRQENIAGGFDQEELGLSLQFKDLNERLKEPQKMSLQMSGCLVFVAMNHF